MNNATAMDCFLYGALIGAGILATGGLCWALAYRGRKRWSAERRDGAVARTYEPYMGATPMRRACSPPPPPQR